jgi:CRISPR-associated endonuclease/helicase Cas3
MSKWEDETIKESHPNKTLKQHIEEIRTVGYEFLRFFEFDKKYFDVLNFLAEYHDKGKLHIEWKLGEKKGHSHFSFQYILENKDKLDFSPKELLPVLCYLILKHHSILSRDLSGFKDMIYTSGKYQKVENAFFFFLSNFLSNFSTEEIRGMLSGRSGRALLLYMKKIIKEINEVINIGDVFGIFKIADVISAENMTKNFGLLNPIIDEKNIKNFFEKIDEKRWEEQVSLSTLPQIGIIRAPTGWGKTTAGILFFKNKNPKKIFYLLPTTSSINFLYEFLKNKIGENYISKYFYFFDTEIKEDEERISHLFFYENFLTPYVITTIDQFLLTFLQIGRYHTKRVMFRGSGLIVDEIHLFNPIMLTMFLYFVKKYLSIYKFNVLIMSASLPSYLKEYILRELEIDISSWKDFSHYYEKRRRILWKFIDDNIENHIEDIINEKQRGKKVLVIVNTVEKAIEIASILENEYRQKEGEDFFVIHSRFMFKHRKEKEERIYKLKNENKPHILVSTQVCEVSLDISYDIMFTELAPLESLIQRFGRVNRYGEKGDVISEVNCFIFDISNGEKEKAKKNKYPYSWEDLEYAKKIVKELEENLKNEKMLLEYLDSRYKNFEEFKKYVDRECRELKLSSWESEYYFFFSPELKENYVLNLLNYREGFSLLVLLDPSMILDDETKEEVEEIIESLERGLPSSYSERRKKFARIKEFVVPIPFWWLKDIYRDIYVEKKGFPIVNLKEKVYDKKFGIHDYSYDYGKL